MYVQVALPDYTSAASRLPPELFPLIAGFRKEITRGHSLVCSYWATLYRPGQWRVVSIKSPERFHSFLTTAKSTPPNLPSILDFIETILVEAFNVPAQPWLHLVPLYLKRPLFSQPNRKLQFVLSMTLKTQSLPSFMGERVRMSHTHNAIPKSLSYFNFQCQALHLMGIEFHSFTNFLMIVRSFKKLENLSCVNIGWTDEPPDSLQLFRSYSYPTLKRASLQPFLDRTSSPYKPGPHWVSAIWCWARRRSIGGKQYLLEDMETMEAMKITSLFQAFLRRKHTPTIDVTIRERYDREHDKLTGLKGGC